MSLEAVETYDGNGRVERDVSESQKGAGGDGSDAGEDVVELGSGVVGEGPPAR